MSLGGGERWPPPPSGCPSWGGTGEEADGLGIRLAGPRELGGTGSPPPRQAAPTPVTPGGHLGVLGEGASQRPPLLSQIQTSWCQVGLQPVKGQVPGGPGPGSTPGGSGSQPRCLLSGRPATGLLRGSECGLSGCHAEPRSGGDPRLSGPRGACIVSRENWGQRVQGTPGWGLGKREHRGCRQWGGHSRGTPRRPVPPQPGPRATARCRALQGELRENQRREGTGCSGVTWQDPGLGGGLGCPGE